MGRKDRGAGDTGLALNEHVVFRKTKQARGPAFDGDRYPSTDTRHSWGILHPALLVFRTVCTAVPEEVKFLVVAFSSPPLSFLPSPLPC